MPRISSTVGTASARLASLARGGTRTANGPRARPTRRPRWLLVGVLALGACANPTARYRAHAEQAGFTREEIHGLGFRHVVYRAGPLPAAARTLHLYLDGDGSPWQTPTTVASDPTARDPLVLDLMRQDPAPAILLGRPCYALGEPDPACTPWQWTQGRYSEPVIASLAAAASTLIARVPQAKVTLIGYSGGGVLAALLAPRLPRVTHIMTLASNLDVSAWTAFHRYSPLDGSLDPATQSPLPASLRQTYLFGAVDDNVPRRVATRYLARVPWATVEELPAADHRCCWIAAWPALLARYASASSAD